jgi:hypothetical protein
VANIQIIILLKFNLFAENADGHFNERFEIIPNDQLEKSDSSTPTPCEDKSDASDVDNNSSSEEDYNFDEEYLDLCKPYKIPKLSSYDSVEKYLDQQLYPNCKVKLARFMYRMSHVYKKSKMSKQTLNTLLNIFAECLPPGHIAPQSKKSFMTLIDKVNPQMTAQCRYFCANCKHSLGVSNKQFKKCVRCCSDNIAISLENDVASIIKHFFENRQLSGKIDFNLEKYKRASNPLSYRDLIDGENSKAVKKFSKYDLTLMHNTDGFPAGNSSTKQIWPNFLAISEISPKHRSNYLILTNLWCGNGKPDINFYLENWVEKMKLLSNDGVEWKDPNTHKLDICRASVVVSAVDAPARAALQNLSYYNGQFGCSFCETEGVLPERVSKKQRGKETQNSEVEPKVRYYPYAECSNAPLRTKENMIQHAVDAIDPEKIKLRPPNQKTVKGVKGLSEIAFLPNFDIAKGFSPDLLHSAFLGVVRRHLEILIDPIYKDRTFYFTLGYQNLLSERLKKIRPPNYISRLPRSLKHLPNWKGSEFMWWIIFYALPCLENLLPDEHFKHLFLLVTSLHTFMKEEITPEDIKLCDRHLRKFCSMYKTLYSAKEETFNLHMLIHYGQSVLQSGPLWASSTFLFEAANNFLKKSVHGSGNIPMELHNTAKIYHAIHNFNSICEKNSRPNLNSFKLSCKVNQECLSLDHYRILEHQDGYDKTLTTDVYLRCVVNEFTFTGETYTLAEKTCCSYAIARSCGVTLYIKLQYFISNGAQSFYIAKQLINEGPVYFDRTLDVTVNHIIRISELSDPICGPLSELLKPVLYLEGKFFIPPNVWDTNL